MQTQTGQTKQYRLQSSGLPLAVYREIVAHLRQVDGVEVGLTPQQSEYFDYHQSQVDSLWICHPVGLSPACQQQVEKILAYYSSHFPGLVAPSTLSEDRLFGYADP